MYEVKKEPELTKKEKTQNRTRRVFDKGFNVLQTFVILAAILVILYLILITPHQVDGSSMDPTFKDNEFLIANKMVYRTHPPQRGDVVIFRFSETRDFIKRVIALPGDLIEIKGGNYYINGVYLDENAYLDATVYTDGGAFLKQGGVYVVPEGKVFVSGDNRPFSSDSRAFGPVDIDQVKGKVFLVIYPFNEAKYVSTPEYGPL